MDKVAALILVALIGFIVYINRRPTGATVATPGLSQGSTGFIADPAAIDWLPGMMNSYQYSYREGDPNMQRLLK